MGFGKSFPLEYFKFLCMNESPKVSHENPTMKTPAKEMGIESAMMLIDRVRESLEDGLYDGKEREESERMLRTARLISNDPEVRKETDELLANIKRLYGDEQF